MEKETLIKQIDMFSEMSDESVRIMAEPAVIENYEPGESIIRFGESGKFLGIIVSGEIEISREKVDGSTETLKVLKPGEFFGEMSLMTGEATSADVRALSAASVLQVPHEAIYPIMVKEPGFAASLAKLISKRLVVRELDEVERQRIADAQRAKEDPYSLRNFFPSEGGTILTINCGSSSLKWGVFNSRKPDEKITGLIERIGLEGTRHTVNIKDEKKEQQLDKPGYAGAFQSVVNVLKAENILEGIIAVGHRVVHGGMNHGSAAVIDDTVLQEVRDCERLAPLHIPANLTGIEEAKKVMPSIPHVAVYDTGFHRGLPKHSYIYGIPYEYYEKEGIRRYGFHGMSHKFVALKTATFLRKPFNQLKMITCHLGNGASLAAIDHGRCVDTSMGMTPLEGLIMGTRSGDFDAGALLTIMKEHDMSASDMEKLLMKESGLLGISGVSSDMREILKAASDGNSRAIVAIEAFCYRVKKYIGSYWAALGGLDILIFTGGIGENSHEIRARICQGLSGMGVTLDEDKNRNPRFGGQGAAIVSTEESTVTVLAVPTDEERMIARETARAISRKELSGIVRTSHKEIPIGVSAHHAHLSQEHVEILFGKGHKLTEKSPLKQPGQFACEERVTLVGPKGKVERVRVLGPERPSTQVEISRTEEFKLGIDAPVRLSGNLGGTPGLTIEGPEGTVHLEEGVVCAQRHIHMSPEDALGFGIHDRDTVMVEVLGDRRLIFGDVIVRVKPSFVLELHLDTDEANAAEVDGGMRARLHSIQSRS